ncbi:MAG TPA: glycerophosphodiester phosphodiesterase family protein [Polyangiaceae bacterium]|nr:glycerophosphodiester phosphodiesterase family protein [Polyangiaceae bacterium]
MNVPALPDAFRHRGDRPAIVGHRGVRGPLPENTMAAFEEAIRQGADAVELDVRLARSGEVVVLHDPDLVRVAGDPGRAEDLSYAELRAADLGRGERVPLLADVLELAARSHVGVNVELKHDVPSRRALALATARVLAAFPKVDVVVSSFDPWTLAAHRLLAPKRAYAELIHESTYHDIAFLLARGLRFDGVHVEKSLATPARIDRFLRRGYVAAWTILEPAEARRVAALGVAVIITDTPGAILAALAEPAR